MGGWRRQLELRGKAVVGILASAVVVGAAVGLFALAEQIPNGIAARLVLVVGRALMYVGALFATMFFFMAVLGERLTGKLFFIRGKALTPDAVIDLRAKESAPATVPISPGQGVLRVIPIRPGWWLDNTYAEDALPVVAVQDVAHRLPGWDPYDLAVPAGNLDVVAWMPRAGGTPGRRVQTALPVPVPEGGVGVVVFRPSSVPELGGTVESLRDELIGKLSLLRLMLGCALLVVVTSVGWSLVAG
ncbi:hypothetical protein AB0J90_01270 [Micromonospora sp. NPDC049523]|uniref:hypothetical protein n=1 Tax=Micromonospora sp. NPDC049523 TaxID=3155921 RepID=UPI00342E435B